MLFRICGLESDQELFTTLYAQRLFFVVQQGETGMSFESVSRIDARLKMESRLRQVRRSGKLTEFQALQSLYKRTFQ